MMHMSQPQWSALVYAATRRFNLVPGTQHAPLEGLLSGCMRKQANTRRSGK